MATPRKENPQKAGRPSSFRPEFVAQARKLALLGHTDEELAKFFEVSTVTINAWKRAHPEFLNALNDGRENADAKVVDSLYRRALGVKVKAVKIVADAKTGAEHIVPYHEHYPPDTTAAIFWLKNRQRGKWRDRQDVEHGITDDAVEALRLLNGRS